MHLSKISGIAVAALFAAATSAIAQTATQAQTQPKNDQKNEQTAAVQTFTGCLMTETAYRSAHHLGAGAAGGLGLGDEFVLVDARISPAKGTPDMTSTPSPNAPAAPAASASTCADKGMAYRLTGTQEEKIKPMNIVGHEIEVQGRFKHADDVTASGAPMSGDLPAEVEIVSFREAPAPAPVATSEPAPARPATVPPPPPTVAPATPPPSTPAPTATVEPKELPHTASSSGLIALIGVLALGSSLMLAVWRRRVA